MAERKEAGVGVGTQAFQPGQSEAMADWTNASKGQAPDQSLGIAIEGAASAFGNSVKAKFNYVTDTISQKATEAVDAVQNMTLGYEDDIARRAGNTQELTDAYRAGAISPAYYWMHMDQASRALRAQYPNFRDNIDAEFAKRTGGIPANKVIQELQENASRRGKTEEQKKNDLVTKWLADGKAGPGVTAMMARGETPSFEYIASQVYQREAKEADMKSKDALRSSLKSQGEYTNDMAVRDATGMLEGLVQGTYEDATSVVAKDYAGFQAKMKQFKDTNSAPNPKEFAEIRMQIQGLTEKTKAEGRKNFSKYKMDIKDVGTRAELIKQFEADVDAKFATFLNEQYGTATYQKAVTTYAVENTDAKVMADESSRVQAVYKTRYGDAWNEMQFNQDPELFNARQKTTSALYYGKVAVGEANLTGAVQDMDKTGEDSMTKRAVIEKGLNNLSDPSAPQALKDQIVSGYFGVDNQNFLNTVNPKDRAALYSTMTNPKVAAEMKRQKELGNDKGFREYQDWVEQSFLALQKPLTDTMIDARNRKNFDVEYSPILKQFVQKTVQRDAWTRMTPGQEMTSNLMEKYNKSAAKDAMTDINTALAGLDATYKAMGMTDEEINKSFAEIYGAMGQAGQRTEPGQDTLFKYLEGLVRGTLPDEQPKGAKKKNGAEQQIADSQLQPENLSPLATTLEEVGIEGITPPDQVRVAGEFDITPAAPLSVVQPPDRTLATQYYRDTITDQAIIETGPGGSVQRAIPFRDEAGNQGTSQSQGVSLIDNRSRTTESAAIRYNNPGAQYPGPISSKYGATSKTLADGHKIAVFPDAVSGAAAQFELLSTSGNYKNKTLRQAISTWSGGNNVSGYVKLIESRTGVSGNTKLTPELLSDPAFAIPLAKAMARQEGGKEYPLTDEQWAQAHKMANPTQVAESRLGSSTDREINGTAAGQIPRFNALRVDDLSTINQAVIGTESIKDPDEREAYSREMKGEYYGIYNMRRQALAYYVMNLPEDQVSPKKRQEAKALYEQLGELANKDYAKYKKDRTPGNSYYESGKNSVARDILEQVRGDDSVAALRKILGYNKE